MFGYVPGGYARILETFAERLRERGVEIRLDARVEKVASLPDQRLQVDSGASSEAYERVIFTTPTPIASYCCPELSEAEHERLRGVDYLGIVCASLLLKKPISPYYVTNITDMSIPMTAVIEMTTIVDPAELGGSHLVYLPKYVHCKHELFDRSDDDIQQDFLAALEKMHPHFSRDDVLAFRISRVRNVMALPTLQYSERLPAVVTSMPGLYLVTSAQILKGNLNVNETIEIAEEGLSVVEQSVAAELAESQR
ncbi:MAG: FAD-dependent oxidoreductase [Planctomycetales bacterium]|nr:FAD-dependent oxidoreductase [Planctomycetales bacterium]